MMGLEFEVSPGEAVGMLAAQSVIEPITQELLRLFHKGGMDSGLALEELPRLTAILMARKQSAYTDRIFCAYAKEGIESARNAIVDELVDIFVPLEDVKINKRHLQLIADAMTQDGEVRGIHTLILKRSVLGRTASHAANRHLVAAAISGEKDYLTGNTENIIVGRQIPVGTGSVRLSADESSHELRSRSRPDEPEFEEEQEGEPEYATIIMKVGKNLGSRNPTWHNAYRNLLMRKRPLSRPDYKSERNFYNANSILRLVCGKFNVPGEMKEGIAILYRKCINSRLTNGRDTYAMAVAVVSIVCKEWGVERDVDSIARELDVKTERIDSCIRIIRGRVGYKA